MQFTRAGKRLKLSDTPGMLGLKDNDQIEVTQPSGTPVTAAKDAAPITIRVKDMATGEITNFKVKKTMRMEQLVFAYATRQGTSTVCNTVG